MKSKITTPELELLVARHFDHRANIIVPNVFWGLGLAYEADIVVLRPSGYAVEVELKITASDIRAECQKKHSHNSWLFRELWFAVPAELADHPDIPENAGILAAGYSLKVAGDLPRSKGRSITRMVIVRAPYHNKMAKRWDAEQRLKLLHLGAMRIWSLKEHNLTLARRRGGENHGG